MGDDYIVPPLGGRSMPPGLPSKNIGSSRYFIALFIFGLYPVWLGMVLPRILGGLPADSEGDSVTPGPALGSDSSDLLYASLEGLILFGVFVFLAWQFSKFSRVGIGWKWPDVIGIGETVNKFFKSILWGVLWSIALRIGVAIVAILGVFVLALFTEINEEKIQDLAPNVESLIDKDSLAEDKTYLLLNLTLISFVVAGFREELWRGITIFLMFKCFPGLSQWKYGKLFVISIIAVCFGLGHLPQGPVGVIMTTLLGFGLGLIQIHHRSIWEATMAHGFFNAASFYMMHALPEIMDKLDSLEESSGLFLL